MVTLTETGRGDKTNALEIGLWFMQEEIFVHGGMVTRDGAVQLNTDIGGRQQHVSFDSLKWIVEMVEELIGEENIAD